MTERILQAAFSREVIFTVIAGQLLVISLIALLLAASRIYRALHRRRVLRLLQLQDVRKARRNLERAMRGKNIKASNVDAIQESILGLTASLYALGRPTDRRVEDFRSKAESYLEAVKFPEVLLPRGERAELMCQRDPSGKLVLDLFLRRELNKVYALDVAARALKTVEAGLSGPREAITIQRVRAGAGRHLSRKVLRFVASSAVTPLKSLAKAELGETGNSSYSALG